MKTPSKITRIKWADVEASINTLENVEGGYTLAKRGLVTLPNGLQVFFKEGVDAQTGSWSKKEVAVYEFLEANQYPFIPKLLAHNKTDNAFAIEALTDGNGWEWLKPWTNKRLRATLQAMDTLEALTSAYITKKFPEVALISAADDGWGPLARSKERQVQLLTKLRNTGRIDIAEALDFDENAVRSSQFSFRDDTLVHYDVRSDNSAWNNTLAEVKLVDWSFAQIGDTRIDSAAVFVDAQRSGLDVLPEHTERLDASALQWLAGFWLNSAPQISQADKPDHLRDYQL